MKQAVMYGAGNIGRGFLGQLFHLSGYETVFVDVNPEVIQGLNERGRYPIYLTEGDSYREYWVTKVRGVLGRDSEAVACAIAEAEVMATAVGVKVLSLIAEPIAAGIRRRRELGVSRPLSIIVCENMIGADRFLAKEICRYLSEAEISYFERYVGLVEPSIGRMVPKAPEALLRKEPLAVCAEPYCELPVDRAGFRGEIPVIAHMVPYAPFDFFIRRKLFLHNMSHGLTAYLGALRGYTYVWEAIADQAIREVVKEALGEASVALSLEYGVPREELDAFCLDLLSRFDNRLLGDTVSRVGWDSARKLSPSDRLVGAARLCEKQGIEPTHILWGIAAGLRFSPEGDEASARVAARAREDLGGVLGELCGISEDSSYGAVVKQVYERIGQGIPLEEWR